MRTPPAEPDRSGPEPTPRTGNPVPEADVAAMFDEIAPVYDRVNTLMTAGRDERWRRAAVRATQLGSGGSAIDVACGTGKLTLALAERVGPFGRIVGVDLAPHMIEEARRVSDDLVQVEFIVGNALALPFERATFDAATIAFGLRNLADFEGGFRELARVVRPGGRVVCLELSTPRPRIWGWLYLATFRFLAPLAAAVFARRRAYRYLPASLEGFPDPAALAATMTRAGLRDVGYRRLALGAVALHSGVVPD
ncbi:MAG: demethylmenaquinone methyltransferase / 2-methoxy-6-polyprenyl,4-benzoquinol methylase [Chloroflexota bacterium]|jgi:demethylmenaquinone methyltransferase/2-methoxy-6-polyprenyl-1,4-benzoquinol methylase|nr:demethylmenaquinone methyltransferase / 2-methoxy-6-polyprenyl,4-benzoquinol methylase [Chloroflexota bacterium]